MKKLLIFALITGTALTFSCSKSSTSKPTPPTSATVTISGTAYNTVKIGNQTWTTVNYNGPGGVNYGNSSSNIPANGKLYTLTEFKAITLPTGWALPTQTDYTTLLASSSAYRLMANTSWTVGGGTNTSGFNALAVGYYDNTSFSGTGTDAVFLTTSTLVSEAGIPASFDIYQDNTGTSAVLTDIVVTATDRAAIRFVKNN